MSLPLPVLNELYDYDQQTKSYLIKISPDNYLDLFNKLDHYPIRKRDLAQSIIDYIEDCSKDIPFKKGVKFQINIKNQSQDLDLENRCRKGLKNYFDYTLEVHKKYSYQVQKTSLLYFCLFIVLSFTSFYLQTINYQADNILFNTLLEGIAIGSWVFLWEAIVGVVMKNKNNRLNIKTYKRLLISPIEFTFQRPA